MQSAYDASFEREMACTPQEWLAWLPAAIGEHTWQLDLHAAHITLSPTSSLALRWEVLTPKRIALLRMPRLKVCFEFEGTDAAQRYRFMKRFDLYMQRGGG